MWKTFRTQRPLKLTCSSFLQSTPFFLLVHKRTRRLHLEQQKSTDLTTVLLKKKISSLNKFCDKSIASWLSRRNVIWRPFTFCVNAKPGAKYCEMQNVKKVTQIAKKVTNYPAIWFSFFTFYERFVLFHNKCIRSMHPSESDTITAFHGEKGVSQLDKNGNVFNTFNMYDKYLFPF